MTLSLATAHLLKRHLATGAPRQRNGRVHEEFHDPRVISPISAGDAIHLHAASAKREATLHAESASM
jgi:hypothetical protein